MWRERFPNKWKRVFWHHFQLVFNFFSFLSFFLFSCSKKDKIPFYLYLYFLYLCVCMSECCWVYKMFIKCSISDMDFDCLFIIFICTHEETLASLRWATSKKKTNWKISQRRVTIGFPASSKSWWRLFPKKCFHAFIKAVPKFLALSLLWALRRELLQFHPP